MAFKKQDRYWVTRIHEVTHQRVFMNDRGNETSLPASFGGQWRYGMPATLTLHQAELRCKSGNWEIRPWMPDGRPECLWTIHLITPEHTYHF